MSRVIDLRSDTMTRPSAAMRQAMANAEVGDDMNAEDPTVNRLEQMVIEMFNKEAAVYCCSGTQSNQMAVWAHCHSGDEILIEGGGHIASFEGGAPAALSGVTCRALTGHLGMLDLPQLEGQIRADNQHLAQTKLLCVENTTNVGGGHCYPVEMLERVSKWAHSNRLQVHMDGARLFNAVVATGQSAAKICEHIDSISVCFSKGLGCPMGSVLIGSKDLIHRARRARKMFGGALRQAGIVAASAVYALENNIERLAEDHENAKFLAKEFAKIPGIKTDPAGVPTNLVYFEVDSQFGNASQLSYALKRHGVLINAGGKSRLRACTHLDVNREQLIQTVKVVAQCLEEGISKLPGTASGPYSRG